MNSSYDGVFVNLPVGEVLSQGVDFNGVDARKLVESFYEKKFSGYLVMTLQGVKGVEEGILLFKEGSLVAAFYEYCLPGITVFGDASVPHVFNSFAGEFVAADIVSLSNQQVDLVTAFNDKSKLNKPVSKGDIPKMIPKVYSTKFAEGVLSQVDPGNSSKKDLFKKLGLSGLGD